MMNRLEAAARQALEALEMCELFIGVYQGSTLDKPRMESKRRKASTALREALAEQATEPDWKSEAAALRVNEQNLEAKLAQAPAPGIDTLAEARAYADQRWDGEDVPIEWLRHFVDGLGHQAAQQAAEPVAFDVVCADCGGSGLDRKDNNYHCPVCDGAGFVQKMLYTHPSPTQQPLTQPEGYKLVSVERSYDMRVQAILHFNTAKKNGADLDDCMDAAWRATLEAAHGITGSKT